MKRISLSLVALSAVLISGGVAFGQTQPATTTTAGGKQQKLVRMVTINGAQAVREFQNNVELVRAQRQAAIDLKTAIDKEKNAQKKKELQAKLDEVVHKLNENNEAMTKTYGFTLNRNYVMEIESANIYLEVSDEEAAKVEQAEKAKAKK